VIPGRPATAADAPAIQALFDDDPETFAVLEGAPPRPDEALHLLRDRPPGLSLEDKFVYLIDGLAVIDMARGYPDEHTWYLGLIYVARGARGAGLGTQMIEALCSHVQSAGGRALRLAVVAGNTRARRLYDRLGFVHVARRSRATWSGEQQEVDVLERAITTS